MYRMLKMFCLIVICLTVCCNSFAQTKDVDYEKSGLSPEGQVELKKVLDEYPKFDEEKPSKDFDDKNKKDFDVKFSKEKLNEVRKQGDNLFAPFKQGEPITVETRKKTYTGAFGGMVGGKLKVGTDFVPTVDLSQDILDKANSDLMMKKQQDYLKENYYTPKKEFEMQINASKKKYAEEQKELYEKQKADSIAEKKLNDKYPVLSDKAIDEIVNVPGSKLKDVICSKIKDEYSKAQPLKASQADTIKDILEIITKGDSAVVVFENKIIAKEIAEKAIKDKERSEAELKVKQDSENKKNAEILAKKKQAEDELAKQGFTYPHSLDKIQAEINNYKSKLNNLKAPANTVSKEESELDNSIKKQEKEFQYKIALAKKAIDKYVISKKMEWSKVDSDYRSSTIGSYKNDYLQALQKSGCRSAADVNEKNARAALESIQDNQGLSHDFKYSYNISLCNTYSPEGMLEEALGIDELKDLLKFSAEIGKEKTVLAELKNLNIKTINQLKVDIASLKKILSKDDISLGNINEIKSLLSSVPDNADSWDVDISDPKLSINKTIVMIIENENAKNEWFKKKAEEEFANKVNKIRSSKTPYAEIDSMELAKAVFEPEYDDYKLMVLANLNESKTRLVFFQTVWAFQPLGNGKCLFKTPADKFKVLALKIDNPKFKDYAFQQTMPYQILGRSNGVTTYEGSLGNTNQALSIDIIYIEPLFGRR